MKTIIKKITAALCVGALISTSPLFSTVAADEANEITLPSGLTISEFTLEINQQNEEVADFASAAVGVFKGNEVVYKNYFGEADKENNIPADDSAVYEWGALQKLLSGSALCSSGRRESLILNVMFVNICLKDFSGIFLITIL